MDIENVEKITISFDRDELWDFAFMIRESLVSTIKTHINRLQNNNLDEYSERRRVFDDQNSKTVMTMELFYGICGRNDMADSAKKKFEKLIKEKVTE